MYTGFSFLCCYEWLLVAFSLKKRAIECGSKEKSQILYSVQRVVCTAVLLAILLVKPKLLRSLIYLMWGREMVYFTALSQAHASLLMEEALTENSLARM